MFLIVMCLCLIVVTCLPLAFLESLGELLTEILDDFSQETYIRLETRPTNFSQTTLDALSSENKYRFDFQYNVGDLVLTVGARLKISWNLLEDLSEYDANGFLLNPNGYELVSYTFSDETIDLERNADGKLSGTGYFEWDGSSSYPEVPNSFFNNKKPKIINVKIELFAPDSETENMLNQLGYNDFTSNSNFYDVINIKVNDSYQDEEYFERVQFLNPIPEYIEVSDIHPYAISPFEIGVKIESKCKNYKHHDIHAYSLKIKQYGNSSNKQHRKIRTYIPPEQDSYEVYFEPCTKEHNEFYFHEIIDYPLIDFNPPYEEYTQKDFIFQIQRATRVHGPWTTLKEIRIPCKVIPEATTLSFFNLKKNKIQVEDINEGINFSGQYFLENVDQNDFKGICMVINEGSSKEVTQWILTEDLLVDRRNAYYEFNWDGKMGDGSWATKGVYSVKIGFRFEGGTWAAPTYQYRERSFTVGEYDSHVYFNNNISVLHNISDLNLETEGSDFSRSFDYQYYANSDDQDIIKKLVYEINLLNNPPLVSQVIDNPPLFVQTVNSETESTRGSLTWDGYIFDNSIPGARMAEGGDEIQFKLGFQDEDNNWINEDKYTKTENVEIKVAPIVNLLSWLENFELPDLFGKTDIQSWQTEPLEFKIQYEIDKREVNISGIYFKIGQTDPDGNLCFSDQVVPVSIGEKNEITFEFDGNWEAYDGAYTKVSVGNDNRPVSYEIYFCDESEAYVENTDKIEGEFSILPIDVNQPSIEIDEFIGNPTFSKSLAKTLDDDIYHHSFAAGYNIPGNPNLSVKCRIYVPSKYKKDEYAYEIWFDLIDSDNNPKTSNKIFLNKYASKYIPNPFSVTYFYPSIIWGGYEDDMGLDVCTIQAKLGIYKQTGNYDQDGNPEYSLVKIYDKEKYAKSSIKQIQLWGPQIPVNVPIEVDYFSHSDPKVDFDLRNKVSIDRANFAFSIAKMKLNFLEDSDGSGSLTYSNTDEYDYSVDPPTNTPNQIPDMTELYSINSNLHVDQTNEDAIRKLIADNINKNYTGYADDDHEPRQSYIICVGNAYKTDGTRDAIGFYQGGNHLERGVVFYMEKMNAKSSNVATYYFIHEMGHLIKILTDQNLEPEFHTHDDYWCVMNQYPVNKLKKFNNDNGTILEYQSYHTPHFCNECVQRLLDPSSRLIYTN